MAEETAPFIEPKRHRWYRIDGVVLYCTQFTTTRDSEILRVDMRGIKPEDYADYMTHMTLWEKQSPYRSVGEVKGIPMPEMVRIVASLAKIEEIDAVDALRETAETNESKLEKELAAIFAAPPSLPRSDKGVPCISCGKPICLDCFECHDRECEQYTPCEM